MATLRFDKLTVKAQEALQAAQEFGSQSGQQQIEPIHLLWALLTQNDGVVPPLLSKLGVSPESLVSEIDRAVAKLPKVSGVSENFLGKATNDALSRAFEEAARFKDDYVSTEHMFLGIAPEDANPRLNFWRGPASPTTPSCRRWPGCAGVTG